MDSPGELQMKKIPIPQPAWGEVLIKVECAPINPSDLYYMKGDYDKSDVMTTKYPTSPGWEGSGTIVQYGGGLFGWMRNGCRVSFVRKVDNGSEFNTGGTY